MSTSLGCDHLGRQVGHEETLQASEVFDGSWPVAGVDEYVLALGAHEVAANLDIHVGALSAIGEGVGIAAAKCVPSLVRHVGPQVGQGRGVNAIHVGQGNDIDVADLHLEVTHDLSSSLVVYSCIRAVSSFNPASSGTSLSVVPDGD